MLGLDRQGRGRWNRAQELMLRERRQLQCAPTFFRGCCVVSLQGSTDESTEP